MSTRVPLAPDTRIGAYQISTDRRNFDVLPDGRFIGVALSDGDDSGATARPREIRIALNWFEELKSRVPTR